MNKEENKESIYAVYIVLNQNKYGIGIYFDWEKINKNCLSSKCKHNIDIHSSINFKEIINQRENCFDNNCLLKDENLLGIYEGNKIDMFWNDFYSFTKEIIQQKVNNETSILDIMESRLKRKKNKNINIETYWPQLENVIGTC